MSTVIKVEELGKKYIINHQNSESYSTLRDSIAHGVKNCCRAIFNPSTIKKNFMMEKEEFWALTDVNFKVEQGDKIGIIGRNGAGKSTLLKLLSRITDPSTGCIKIKGRVASLLEVGTGFHPELTGRENIFLNGAVLGMSRSEIIKKFDDIVAFAEVEKFLDTPVKRYSSGMYVRLAFSVAAHLEPEILVVDEVLAVGDSQFQKKCLGRMNEIGREGRTVLFVSHNMTAIKALCNKGILLEKGAMRFQGDIDPVVEKYLLEAPTYDRNIPIAERKRERRLSLRAKIVGLDIITDYGTNPELIDSTKTFTVRMTIDSQSDTRSGAYLVVKDNCQVLSWFDSGHLQNRIYQLKKGINIIDCYIKPSLLTSGEYKIDCGLTLPNQEWIDMVPDAYTFTVENFDPYGSGFNLSQTFARYHIDHNWSELIKGKENEFQHN